uniref:Uncharacterized protein n=1 Tax=Arundo donax TaxID=35708 RepID=A0A0A9B1D1_ARUDO
MITKAQHLGEPSRGEVQWYFALA